MYHYVGTFKLYETIRSGRASPLRSGFRCPCTIGDEYWDCVVDFVGTPEISPGDSTEVQISFLSIAQVSSLLRVGGSYLLCDGTRPIGEVEITRDVWSDIHSVLSEGEVRHAVVERIDWTRARLLLDGGIIAGLTSEDVGLQPWDEIGQTLHCGDTVTVRI